MSDLPWAFAPVGCCLSPGYAVARQGPMPWPDLAPFNTPGQTYYAAVMVDNTLAIPELNENNNWGQVFPVTLCARPGDASGNDIVDLDDYRRLHDCVSGPFVPDAVGCLCADQDGDNDVDLADVGAFQNVLQIP